MSKVLWLASWYPNKISPSNGDFIQRHAEAASLFTPVHVIFVVKDSEAVVTKHVTIEHYTRGSLSESIAYYRPLKSGVKIFDRFVSILTYLDISRKLVKSFLRQHGCPALVHLHVVMWAGLLALWLKRNYRIPFVVTEHWTGYQKDAVDNFYSRGRLFRQLTRKVLQHASLLLPVSHQLGKCIHDNVFPVTYNVVPNVVDTRYFNLAHHTDLVFRFIHVSSMNQQKNVPDILEAFSNVVSHHGNCKLVLVGPSSALLKNTASTLQIDQFVEWKGTVSYNEVAEEMAVSDAFVLFSNVENLPCVILEALCHGLPVIATDVGGIAEIITPGNGILVTAGDGTQLQVAMREMIEKYSGFDKATISAVAMEKYNYQTVGKMLYELYRHYGVV